MDVVVSGSHGLVGRALVAALGVAGHRPIRLVRSSPAGGDAIAWDPAAGTIDAAALEGLDAVVHLAAEGIGARRWSAAQRRRIHESRTRGTALLAGALAARARPPRVLLSASAVGYYGDRGDEVLDEASGPGEGFLAGVVRDWEAAARPAAEAGIRTAFLRSGVILSAAGGMLPRLLLPFRLGLGGRTGSGRQYLPWITIDDEVAAIVHLLGDGAALDGPVNLTAPEPVPNREFAATLARVLRRPAVLPTPLPLLRLRYGRDLVDELLLCSQRVVPRRLVDAGFAFRHADLETALRAVTRRVG